MHILHPIINVASLVSRRFHQLPEITFYLIAVIGMHECQPLPSDTAHRIASDTEILQEIP